MKGGYQILDLRAISLELSSETQNITNEGVLKQLRALRDYIEKDHDYTKPLNEALKPILIRYRDGKTNELLEVSGFATIISSNASLTYEIKCKDLMIEVVFEEKTDDYGNKYYDIKTAKYIYSKNELIEGDLVVGGNAKLFENIVDTQGHKRFVEFVGVVPTIEGVIYEYGRASLSGTHLMIVLAGDIDDAVEVLGNTLLATFELPSWILDKIIPVWDGKWLEYKNVSIFADNGSSQGFAVGLRKSLTGLEITKSGDTTTTSIRHFRIVFDLLIDNKPLETDGE